jgi:hypothetical protein
MNETQQEGGPQDLYTLTAPPASKATWEDLLDIFYAPREVFERRKDGKFWIILIGIALLSSVIYFLSQQLMEAVQDAEIARQVKSGKLSAEQVAAAAVFTKKFATVAVYLMPIFITIGAFLTGLVIWLVGLAMKAKANFAQATVIGLLAGMPEMLERVLVGAQGMMLDTAQVSHRYSFSLGAARFLDAESPNWMLKFASLADPFVLWGVFLLALGAHVIGKLEMEKAAVLAIVVTVISALAIR